MALTSKSNRRKISFDILEQLHEEEEGGGNEALDDDRQRKPFLHRSNSDPTDNSHHRKKRKHRKKNRAQTPRFSSVPETPFDCLSLADAEAQEEAYGENLSLELDCKSYSVVETSTSISEVVDSESSNVCIMELRQRTATSTANGSVERETDEEKEKENSEREPNGGGGGGGFGGGGSGGDGGRRLDTAGSLDWKNLMAQDPYYIFSMERSPVKNYIEELNKGCTLQRTAPVGSDSERERVYDTIFRLPWRCELLINISFFVCFDSFLSLLIIMPTRLLMILWRLMRTRKLTRPSAVDLSYFGCFVILSCGVLLLERTDISLIYHMIRGQGTIKLYVVYNVLEIFDKLCQSFGGDVLGMFFNSAQGVATCSVEDMRVWNQRFICDLALAVVASIIHSFILLAQAITLSTCIVAHNNALLALLVSNNFAEIKSYVFKRYSKDNVHSLVYTDSVERFHISAFLSFVLAQNILESEAPWFESFVLNALLVYVCEMMIDIIKHSFIAKFNDIKPIAYSEFLEELCKQILNIEPHDRRRDLTFVPIAPACVVIRVLTPVYATHLYCNPLIWRLFKILLLSGITYVMLASMKLIISMGLHEFATWYVNRCRKRRHHLHSD